MTNQYSSGRNLLAAIWAAAATMKMPMKMTLLAAYPKFIDIETASPPVSPSVVARTLMTQNVRVTSGTLLSTTSVPR
jgi:hypothetical protein